MSVAPFTVEVVLVFLVTLYVLHQYGNLRKQHYVVTVAVFISWFFSFLIIFILPLDVSSTFYRQCLKEHQPQHDNNGNGSNILGFGKYNGANQTTNTTGNSTFDKNTSLYMPCQKPWSFMPEKVLPDLWLVVYWSSQILSWIVLPIMQSYSYAGDFTVKGKIKTALIENAMWYGSYLIIFLGLLLYVVFHPDLDLNGDQLKVIGITASNTWGLVLLVFLMGYGLVEVPRSVWLASKLDYQIAHIYFNVSKMSTEKEEAQEKLNEVLSDVRKASESIRYNNRFRKHLEVIMKKCPDRDQETFDRGTDDYVDYDDGRSGRMKEIYEEKDLVKLHRQVIAQTQITRKARCQWNRVIEQAFQLEDLQKNANNRERVYKSALEKQNVIIRLPASLEWYWKVWLKPWCLRILCVILAILSVALIWSEVTFFIVKPRLSLFALFLNEAQKGYFYFYVELVSWVTITYMCICVYYTVFRIRIFNYYYFAPHHQTDPNSLLFSGLLLCRLTYALCLNFLSVIHLDSHITGQLSLEDTAFTSIMGHMDVLSFIANGFNIYYPMSIVLVCLATFFSLGSRCMNCLGFQAFIIEDDLSVDYVAEGKDLVRREKRRDMSINPGDTARKRWSSRAQELKNKLNYSKGQSSRVIDTDADPTPTPTVAGSSTRLVGDRNVARYLKPTRTEDDRIELLSDVDDHSYHDYPSARYNDSPSRSDRSSVPKNVFDDI